MKIARFSPRSMDSFPRPLEEGILYISEKFGMAAHNCACGCGHEVMTPLKPTQWKLKIEQGGAATLYPSIGNWGFPCCSHYWIRGNEVMWSYHMSDAVIRRNRQLDQVAREAFYRQKEAGVSQSQAQEVAQTFAATERRGSAKAATAVIKRMWKTLFKS